MRPFLTLLLCSPLVAQDVLVVDASGAGDHVDLPPAVAAAAPGDVLLVRGGMYSAPTVSQDVTIVADGGVQAVVRGHMRVQDLPADQTVLLSGLALRHRVGVAERALTVRRCHGFVRLDTVSAQGGGFESLEFGHGRPGVAVRRARNVAFLRSQCTGGTSGENEHGPPGPRGGAGLRVREATVAAWRSAFQGGAGGDAALILSFAGEGGPGAELKEGARMFAYLDLFRGGDGGDSLDFSSDFCGPGGPGLLARLHELLVEQSAAFVGGQGGVAQNFPKVCDDGPPNDVVGAFESLPGVPRGLEGPRVLREGETSQFTAFGRAGDRVLLAWSLFTGFRHVEDHQGGWLLPPTLVSLEPIGTLDGSGSFQWSYTQPDLGAGELARVSYVQLLVIRPDGTARVGSPITIVALDSTL